ncbi:MAG TPA: hypothetical protein VJV78_18575 [Polyangiales bacterium]|nr:hypothetical protein [Polyangiales bacterium]
MEMHSSHAQRTSKQFRTFLFAAVLGSLAAACAGTGAESLDDAIEVDDVAASQQELTRAAVGSTAVASTSGKVISNPPVIKDPGTVVVYFQCGWDPKSLSAQCTCHGDADCNRMFTSGFCGANASCDSGNNSCTCDLKL